MVFFAIGDCNGKGGLHTPYNDFQIVEIISWEIKKEKFSDRDYYLWIIY
jgi:hypothetical protein